nr:hypothetical protein [Rhizobium aethiopicum]
MAIWPNETLPRRSRSFFHQRGSDQCLAASLAAIAREYVAGDPRPSVEALMVFPYNSTMHLNVHGLFRFLF